MDVLILQSLVQLVPAGEARKFLDAALDARVQKTDVLCDELSDAWRICVLAGASEAGWDNWVFLLSEQ